MLRETSTGESRSGWRALAWLTSEEGVQLAQVVVRAADLPREVLVERVVSGKGSLLGHYFGRGERRVRLDVGGFRLRGHLHTRWLGHGREWIVELTPLDSAASPASAWESSVDIDSY